MLKTTAESNDARSLSPDYLGLVQFLLEPLLESPESLSIDCEKSNQNRRVWIRLAFEGTDKGRVYGRGGRNLQAIRTVLATAAATVGQSLYLDIYEGQSDDDRPKRRNYRDSGRKVAGRRHRSHSSISPRFSMKPRF